MRVLNIIKEKTRGCFSNGLLDVDAGRKYSSVPMNEVYKYLKKVKMPQTILIIYNSVDFFYAIL